MNHIRFSTYHCSCFCLRGKPPIQLEGWVIVSQVYSQKQWVQNGNLLSTPFFFQIAPLYKSNQHQLSFILNCFCTVSTHELYSKQQNLLRQIYRRGILPPNVRKTKLHAQDFLRFYFSAVIFLQPQMAADILYVFLNNISFST